MWVVFIQVGDDNQTVPSLSTTFTFYTGPISLTLLLYMFVYGMAHEYYVFRRYLKILGLHAFPLYFV